LTIFFQYYTSPIQTKEIENAYSLRYEFQYYTSPIQTMVITDRIAASDDISILH